MARAVANQAIPAAPEAKVGAAVPEEKEGVAVEAGADADPR